MYAFHFFLLKEFPVPIPPNVTGEFSLSQNTPWTSEWIQSASFKAAALSKTERNLRLSRALSLWAVVSIGSEQDLILALSTEKGSGLTSRATSSQTKPWSLNPSMVPNSIGLQFGLANCMDRSHSGTWNQVQNIFNLSPYLNMSTEKYNSTFQHWVCTWVARGALPWDTCQVQRWQRIHISIAICSQKTNKKPQQQQNSFFIYMTQN